MAQTSFLDSLEPILPLIADRAQWATDHRRPDPDVFRLLAEAGLLRLMAPAHYGGHGAHPEDFLNVVEAVARVDGSTAWAMMTINEEVGIASAYLQPESMTALLTGQPEVIIAGAGFASGRAEPRPGGWSISGRWPLVSGSNVADRLVLNSLVDRGDGARGAQREMCYALVPAADAQILDTWHVTGLRGTGSNDVVLDDVFVSDEWAGVAKLRQLPRPETPFYCLPSGLRFPFPKVGVATGIATAALHHFTELAAAKRPSMGRRPLAQRPYAHAAIARAEALIGSGRAWVGQQLTELWAAAGTEAPIDPELHAKVRLACAHAVDSAITAVETLALAAGTTASQQGGPWPRLLGDVRSVGQHYMVAPYQMDTAGRMLLGLDPDDPLF